MHICLINLKVKKIPPYVKYLERENIGIHLIFKKTGSNFEIGLIPVHLYSF